MTEHVDVKENVSTLQSDTVALGGVVTGSTAQALPLAARNFTQIVDLSPGVLTAVDNAGELGPGGSGLAQIDAGDDGIFVHGTRSYDNAYESDVVPVTDLQASNIASGGIPIPNPDTIQEFKVQTGLYNVSFGEHAGASVSLVTKSGTNSLHRSVFEYLRNNLLNANDFFRNRVGLPRAELKQFRTGAVRDQARLNPASLMSECTPTRISWKLSIVTVAKLFAARQNDAQFYAQIAERSSYEQDPSTAG